MFIYNVTIKIDFSIHDEWVAWMKDIHIPEVLKSGCFEKAQFVRLMDIDESEGPTYAAQYYAISKAQYNRYIDMYAPKLREASMNKWGNKFIAFRTLMEVIE
jgi:hypothetical protein